MHARLLSSARLSRSAFPVWATKAWAHYIACSFSVPATSNLCPTRRAGFMRRTPSLPRADVLSRRPARHALRRAGFTKNARREPHRRRRRGRADPARAGLVERLPALAIRHRRLFRALVRRNVGRKSLDGLLPVPPFPVAAEFLAGRGGADAVHGLDPLAGAALAWPWRACAHPADHNRGAVDPD